MNLGYDITALHLEEQYPANTMLAHLRHVRNYVSHLRQHKPRLVKQRLDGLGARTLKATIKARMCCWQWYTSSFSG
jgi:hypothetical protein